MLALHTSMCRMMVLLVLQLALRDIWFCSYQNTEAFSVGSSLCFVCMSVKYFQMMCYLGSRVGTIVELIDSISSQGSTSSVQRSKGT